MINFKHKDEYVSDTSQTMQPKINFKHKDEYISNTSQTVQPKIMPPVQTVQPKTSLPGNTFESRSKTLNDKLSAIKNIPTNNNSKYILDTSNGIKATDIQGQKLKEKSKSTGLNAAKGALDTGAHLAMEAGTGFVKGAEGISDFVGSGIETASNLLSQGAANVVSGIGNDVGRIVDATGKLFNNEGMQKVGTAIQNASKKTVKDNKNIWQQADKDMSNIVKEDTTREVGQATGLSQLKQDIRDKSYAKDTIWENVANGLGNMSTYMFTGPASTAIMFANVAGNSTEKALNDGATYDQARLYGIVSGIVSVATEKLSEPLLGMTFGGLGKIAPNSPAGKLIGKISDKVGDMCGDSQFASALLSKIASVGEEVFEEELEKLIDPIIDKIYKDGPIEWATKDEYMNTALETALTTLILGGASDVANVVANRTGNNINNVQDNDINNNVAASQIENNLNAINNRANIGENVQEDVITPPTQNNPNMVQNEADLTNLGTNQQASLPNQMQNVSNNESLLQNQIENVQNNQNITPPTQKAQDTLTSAKLAGMSDMTMQKAVQLNSMINSGANLVFYDADNLPQGITDDKAKKANGFYKDGIIYINKDSKHPVLTILGHELTHHLEQATDYTTLKNTILDSDIFYDYIEEKGFKNINEYRNSLSENYSAENIDNEMVARFAEEKMFTNQDTINRLTQQNRTFVEKIKDFISNLVVKFKGTPQENELRKIENMYKKALSEVGENTTRNDVKYSVDKTTSVDNQGRELSVGNDSTQKNITIKETTGNFGKKIRKTYDTETGKQIYFRFDNEDGFKGKEHQSGVPYWEDDARDILYGDGHAYNINEDYLKELKEAYDKAGEENNDKKQDEILREVAIMEGSLTYGASAFDLSDIGVESAYDYIHATNHPLFEYPVVTFFIGEKVGEGADYEPVVKPDKVIYSGKSTDIKDIFDKISFDDLSIEDAYNSINELISNNKDASTSNPDIRYSVDKENPISIANNKQNALAPIENKSVQKQGDTESKFAGSVQKSSIIAPEVKEMAKNNMNIGTYDRVANKKILQKANNDINLYGDKAKDKLMAKSEKDFTAQDIASGVLLMDRYQSIGDYESQILIMEKLRKAGTESGRTVQILSLLGRMTPEGMTYYAQQSLNNAYEKILKRKTAEWGEKNKEKFRLDDKDIDFIQRRVIQASKLPDGRHKNILLAEIMKRVESKIPPEPGQSIKSLARISMLFNSKTMVRNVLGNVVMMPHHIISDFIGTGIDKAISKKTGVRTTDTLKASSFLTGAKKGLYESFEDFRRDINTRDISTDRFEVGQGKSFNENHEGKIYSGIQNRMSKALNGLDGVTSFLLDAGDRPFYEGWFLNSINNQLNANNTTVVTPEMIEVATDEALQRTWQDNNSYTDLVSSIRKGLNKANLNGYGLGDVIMPFVKTPSNLVKAVVDYSPLGAINALKKTTQFNRDIGKHQATATQQRQVVKAWSQVITGSLGMAIIAELVNKGIIKAGLDDDEDVKNFEQNVLGIKPYSIQIGNNSYTYDWAQPLGTQMAMIADIKQGMEKNKEDKLLSALNGFNKGAEVLLNQSFVSGIRNLFKEDSFIKGLINLAVNEGAKFTPSLSSQIAQLGDNKARTSYVYNNPILTGINKVKAKIPGLRNTLPTAVDVLGREVESNSDFVNVMLNPANKGKANSTPEAEEMYNLYKATGDKQVIARQAPYYLNIKGEKIIMTPEERNKYQRTTGNIATEGIKALMNTNAYKKLSDADKAELFKDIYDYGNAIAKSELTDKYQIAKADQKTKDASQTLGITPAEYLMMQYIATLNGTKKEDIKNSLLNAGYSKAQVDKFYNYYKK